jgi:hypothetical protein
MKTVALNVLAAGPECWRAPEKDSPNFSVREGDLNANAVRRDRIQESAEICGISLQRQSKSQRPAWTLHKAEVAQW